MTPKAPQPHQRLWLARWGTQTALVWAGDPAAAEQKVRRRAFDTTITWNALQRLPIRYHGPVNIREATAADVERWREAGGHERPVEQWKAST